MISILQTDNPLDFWASTPLLTFFGSPNFGNKLLDGGHTARTVNAVILTEKIKRDVPSVSKTLRRVKLSDNLDGGIDIEFIYRENKRGRL